MSPVLLPPIPNKQDCPCHLIFYSPGRTFLACGRLNPVILLMTQEAEYAKQMVRQPEAQGYSGMCVFDGLAL